MITGARILVSRGTQDNLNLKVAAPGLPVAHWLVRVLRGPELTMAQPGDGLSHTGRLVTVTTMTSQIDSEATSKIQVQAASSE